MTPIAANAESPVAAGRIDVPTAELSADALELVVARCGSNVIGMGAICAVIAPLAAQVPSLSGGPSGVWLRHPILRNGLGVGRVLLTIDPPPTWVVRFVCKNPPSADETHARLNDRAQPGCPARR
jgi:hypothetical protein